MIAFTLDRILIALVIFSAAGIFLIGLRRLPKALEELGPEGEKVVIESGGDATLEEILKRAESAFERRDYGHAEKFYLKAAAVNPQNPKIYNRLGIIYLENKNFTDASAAFEQAVKIDPNVALRHANLGIAYLEMKKYTLADNALSKAVTLDPKNKKYQKLLQSTGLNSK